MLLWTVTLYLIRSFSFLQAIKSLDPESLFQGEVDETLEHIEKCTAILVSFR